MINVSKIPQLIEISDLLIDPGLCHFHGIMVHVQGVCLPVSLRRLRVWSFQRLSSGGIPAPSAFSRKKHAGAAVSPTAKSLK